MKNISRLNDFFIRYLFGQKGKEDILLDFINTVMLDSDMETFKAIEILNPFNLKDNHNDAETVVDVKATTEKGEIVIIEIQTFGNQTFKDRVLYYWAKNYTTLQDAKINYKKLKPVISINVINFIIDEKHDLPHTTYMIYGRETKRLFTDKLLIHFLELPKSNKPLNTKGLFAWFRFLIAEDLEEEIKMIVKEKPILESAIQDYKYFTLDKDLMSEYDKRETFLVGQSMMFAEERNIGREEGKIEIAKNLLKNNVDIDIIISSTGFTREEIDNLKHDMNI